MARLAEVKMLIPPTVFCQNMLLTASKREGAALVAEAEATDAALASGCHWDGLITSMYG